MHFWYAPRGSNSSRVNGRPIVTICKDSANQCYAEYCRCERCSGIVVHRQDQCVQNSTQRCMNMKEDALRHSFSSEPLVHACICQMQICDVVCPSYCATCIQSAPLAPPLACFHLHGSSQNFLGSLIKSSGESRPIQFHEGDDVHNSEMDRCWAAGQTESRRLLAAMGRVRTKTVSLLRRPRTGACHP